MRYLIPVQAALAGLLLLPALASQSQPKKAAPGLPALERALDDTLRAVEDLAGLRQRLGEERQSGDALTQAVAQALRRTEPPFAEPQALDRRLVELRDEVSRLEELLGRMVAAGGEPLALPPPVEGGGERGSTTPTTGLAPETLAQLARILPSLEGAPTASAPPAGNGSAPLRGSLEEEGFAADGLRLARAYYRAGRYEEALRFLPEDHAEPELRWWRGRTLERLGRLDEADATWRALAADEKAGLWGERAKADLEFLQWKRARVIAPRAPAEAPGKGGPR